MNLSNKTFLPKISHKKRNWFVIDCEGQTLGRLATVVAGLLKGKGKPYYHPAVDVGDYVILKNIDLVVLHEESKHYLVYNPGRPGSSLKVKNVLDCLPELTVKKAVKGMLAETEAKRLMKRLNLYKGNNHLHEAQNPIPLNIASDSLPFQIII